MFRMPMIANCLSPSSASLWFHRFIYGGPGNCGSHHHQVTAAAALALQPPLSRRSADSSPSHSHSHSQMSRNSSRKSNNSVNCKLDGKRQTPFCAPNLSSLWHWPPLADANGGAFFCWIACLRHFNIVIRWVGPPLPISYCFDSFLLSKCFPSPVL